MNNSVWRQTAALPAFRRLSGDVQADVLIIGGGIAGILCAFQLRLAGVDCILIEEDRLCSGITGNTTAKITSQHGLIYADLLRRFGPEMTFSYWKCQQEALEEYGRLCRDISCDFEIKDSYIFSGSSLRRLDEEMEVFRRLGIPADFTGELPIPVPNAGGIRFPNQAQFHPLKFLSEVVKDLNIYEGTKATEFAGNLVITNNGRIRASKIIMATHFPILNKHGGYFLKMYQQRSYVLGLENAPVLEGMYLDVENTGISLRTHGSTLLLGGGGHRTGKQGGCWDYLKNAVQSYFPEAKEVCRWAAQDCMTLDGIPYIGRYGKNTENLYVITGFNKWGMSSAMAGAMLLRDLILERKNPYEGLFSPQRSSFHPQLLKNIGESTWNLLTPTCPRCPHLGCALKWNRQERTWDCPCHGSRFSEKGKRLNEPAEGDLSLE